MTGSNYLRFFLISVVYHIPSKRATLVLCRLLSPLLEPNIPSIFVFHHIFATFQRYNDSRKG